MYESADEQSAYWDYLETLPEQAPSLCSWLDTEDGQALAGFSVHSHAQRVLQLRRRSYKQHVAPALQQHRELFAGLSQEQLSEDRYLWACATRVARSAGDLETAPQRLAAVESLAMVPLMDLVWHRPGSAQGIAQQSVLCCSGPAAGGSTITMDLGALDNDALLLKFGYTLRDNPHDSVELVLSSDDMHPPSEPKRSFLHEMNLLSPNGQGVDKAGVSHDGARVFSIHADFVPRGLMVLLRALVADAAHLTHALLSGAPLSPMNEIAALRLLSDKCEQALKGACSAGDGTDEASLAEEAAMPARARWGAILRAGKRNILRRTLRRAEQLASAAIDYDATVSKTLLLPAMACSAKRPLVLEAYQKAVKSKHTAKLAKGGHLSVLSEHFQPEAFAVAMLAASDEHTGVLSGLLDSQLVTCHHTDSKGRTLLHLAARGGAGSNVSLLLTDGGCVVNMRALGDDGSTPLHHAAAAGQVSVVKELLAHSADPDVMTIEDGYTALHYGALSKSYLVVQALLEQKARVDTLSSTGATPLHVAALGGDLQCARALLGANADASMSCNELDEQGRAMDAAQIAGSAGHAELSQLLALCRGERIEQPIVLDTTPVWQRPAPSLAHHRFSSEGGWVKAEGSVAQHAAPSEGSSAHRAVSQTLVPESQLATFQSNYTLSEQQIAGLRQRGHTLTAGLLDSTMLECYRAHLHACCPEEPSRCLKDFSRVPNLHNCTSTAVQRLVHCEQLAAVASQLLGVSEVKVVESTLLFKQTGDHHTKWHQDHPTLPLDTDFLVTAWVALVPVSQQSGPLEFATGSHLAEDIKPVWSDAEVRARWSIHLSLIHISEPTRPY
eukprot:TRINITY_DN12522_c0_g1_i2.p1 TRINITY_DN12522_c0_g1~~TRINITY_DN12522_c0_g1_i2.p1  ORF type:complete len:840 (-),score=228.65 TRINITY_DN12522_c0_g1_i2:45-2564(-)